MVSIRCRAHCAYRTYGKYRRKFLPNPARAVRILNKDKQVSGTCSLEHVTVDVKGRCTLFKDWEKIPEVELQ